VNQHALALLGKLMADAVEKADVERACMLRDLREAMAVDERALDDWLRQRDREGQAKTGRDLRRWCIAMVVRAGCEMGASETAQRLIAEARRIEIYISDTEVPQ
jgi:hypothetical protein